MPVKHGCRFVLFPGEVVRLVLSRDVLLMHDGWDGEELARKRGLEVVVAGEVGEGGGEVCAGGGAADNVAEA